MGILKKLSLFVLVGGVMNFAAAEAESDAVKSQEVVKQEKQQPTESAKQAEDTKKSPDQESTAVEPEVEEDLKPLELTERIREEANIALPQDI